MLPIAEFEARFRDILAALDDLADGEDMEELNAEFEDALFMLSQIDPKADDAAEEFMDFVFIGCASPGKLPLRDRPGLSLSMKRSFLAVFLFLPPPAVHTDRFAGSRFLSGLFPACFFSPFLSPA